MRFAGIILILLLAWGSLALRAAAQESAPAANAAEVGADSTAPEAAKPGAEEADKEAEAADERDDNDADGRHRRHHAMGVDPETRVLLEEVMVARLSKQLSLNDQETVVLVRKFSEFRDEVLASKKQRMKIMRDLRNELKEGQDGANIDALLSQMIVEDDKAYQTRKAFFEHIGEDLTSWQRGRLYVFLSEFETDMRRMIEKARQQKSGGKGAELKKEEPETGTTDAPAAAGDAPSP
ncbi:MAG: hypothetical protein HYV27_06490 [Candidatus Hydrogenedentes bacterium]|nr:hypothetical protein [Candidatus Hydrogenedentota bacterium]